MPLVIPMPAGKMLSSDGVTWIDKYPPGYLTAVDLGATITSAGVGTTETTILSAGAISNAFLAGVAVGDTVHVRAAGTYTNNTGANQALTVNLYMGATLAVGATSAVVAASATPRNWQIDFEVIYAVIGDGTSGRIRPIGFAILGDGTGAGFVGPAASTALLYNGAAAATVATNAAATGDLKAQFSTATSGATALCNVFRARWFPKNY